jgi:hypothetical protein
LINIPKLLPIVRQEFPKTPLPKLLKVMSDFARTHPTLNDQEAIQAFQMGLQKARQTKASQPLFRGLVNALPTGVK